MHANWIVRYKASDWDVKCNECELFFLHDDDVKTLLYDDDDVRTLLYDTDVITLVVVIWRGTRFLANPL